MARRRKNKLVKADYAEVKCAFCKGTGRDRFPVLSPLSKCPVCNGKGVVRVQKPYEKCKRCTGTGLYFGSHLYCWTCHGKGVVPKE